jgi:hypothetical protein
MAIPRPHVPPKLRSYIEELGPYQSLVLRAVPASLVEPLKLIAVAVAGDGHWITGKGHDHRRLCCQPVARGALVAEKYVTDRDKRPSASDFESRAAAASITCLLCSPNTLAFARDWRKIGMPKD